MQVKLYTLLLSFWKTFFCKEVHVIPRFLSLTSACLWPEKQDHRMEGHRGWTRKMIANCDSYTPEEVLRDLSLTLLGNFHLAREPIFSKTLKIFARNVTPAHRAYFYFPLENRFFLPLLIESGFAWKVCIRNTNPEDVATQLSLTTPLNIAVYPSPKHFSLNIWTIFEHSLRFFSHHTDMLLRGRSRNNIQDSHFLWGKQLDCGDCSGQISLG